MRNVSASRNSLCILIDHGHNRTPLLNMSTSRVHSPFPHSHQTRFVKPSNPILYPEPRILVSPTPITAGSSIGSRIARGGRHPCRETFAVRLQRRRTGRQFPLKSSGLQQRARLSWGGRQTDDNHHHSHFVETLRPSRRHAATPQGDWICPRASAILTPPRPRPRPPNAGSAECDPAPMQPLSRLAKTAPPARVAVWQVLRGWAALEIAGFVFEERADACVSPRPRGGGGGEV
jgi:hypothetical protein